MQVAEKDAQEKLYKRFPSLRREHDRPIRFVRPRIHFIPVTDRWTRKVFDETLDLIHYAGRCQRVGRCLRLCVYVDEVWIGGIVLGSTFPNINVRDEFLGLKTFVRGFRHRGLRNPWSRENVGYWNALQHVVNHARTFVFPRFQGKGLGVAAHRELLNTGIVHWERRYQQKIAALDTLCTHNDSKLFAKNCWKLIGNTRGYTSDPSEVFSSRAFVKDWKMIRNNIGLKRIEKQVERWWVWGIVTDKYLLSDLLRGRPRVAKNHSDGGARRALRML